LAALASDAGSGARGAVLSGGFVGLAVAAAVEFSGALFVLVAGFTAAGAGVDAAGTGAVAWEAGGAGGGVC
jgi:hypothetical protein